MDDDAELGTFQDSLPALKCLRLNNQRSANDGTVQHSDEEEPDDEEEWITLTW
jgi:hypothetical protein